MIEQHNSLAEKFLKKGFWLVFLSFLVGPIGYLIKIIISNELSVEEVGILYGILSLIIILIGYNDFGITESLKYFIPRFYEEKRYDKIKTILFLGFCVQVSTSLILMGLFYFGADFLGNNYFHDSRAIESIKIFSLFFLGINLFQLINTFFLSIQNTFLYRFSDLVRLFTVLLWTLFIFSYEKTSLVNYTYSRIIGLYFGIIFTMVIFYYKYYSPFLSKQKLVLKKELIKEIFLYALLVLAGSQASTILSQIDMQMIIYFLGVKDAGYYTNYLSIIGIFFIVIGPVFTFLLPVFSELIAKKQMHKLKLLKGELSIFFITLSISYTSFMFIFGKSISYSLFGEKFIYSGVIIQYSVLFLVFNFLLQINFNLLAALGKVKERVKIILYAIIFNIIMNFILIHILGVGGAALATGMGWIFILLLSEKKLGEDLKINIDSKKIFGNFVSFLGITGIIYITDIQNILLQKSQLYAIGGLFFIFIIWTSAYIFINRETFLQIKKTMKL